jgi:hypothetical protein
MRIKSAVRYYLNDYKKSVVIFYGVLMAVFLLQLLLTRLLGNEHASSSGMEFASTIFVFVVGMNAFKAPFRLFLQNGLSQETFRQMENRIKDKIDRAVAFAVESPYPAVEELTTEIYA